MVKLRRFTKNQQGVFYTLLTDQKGVLTYVVPR